MNSYSFQETRKNLQTARKVTYHLSSFSPDVTPSSQIPSLKQGSFSSALFNDPKSKIICNLAKESEYIQGMVKGTLDPNVFGGYTVQDAAYCFKAVDSFERAAEKMQEVGKPEFALLYRAQSESYKSYNQYFVQTWRLQNTDSVVMGPAAATYVGYERALSQNDPKYLCIAMLPCTMLWPWIADQLIASVSKNNPYYVWFEDNKPSPGHKSHLEKFVDHFFVQVEPEEWQKCLSIFQEGLVNEVNFFRSACDQTLFYYSSFQE